MRHWIPPGALIFAQIAHGLSWPLLVYTAVAVGTQTLTMPALAWIHTVALGWFTIAALGILIHVIPAFTDAEWVDQRVVRATLVPFALGVALFVAGWLSNAQMVVAGATIVFLAFVVYYSVALATLARARNAERTERAIARALTINLSLFALALVLGTVMALAFVVPRWSPVLVRVPPIHANIALYGWLTMLVFGVSARTVRPIFGVRSQYSWIHIITGTSMLFGPLLVAAGIGWSIAALVWLASATIGVATLVYAFDVIDIARRATLPHRPPQAFIVSAVIWLVFSSILGACALLGKPWWNAFLFAVLIGWIGQMVTAHFFHIGVRLVATIYRGEEDETRPSELLDARLSWACFALTQAAILLCAGGMLVSVTALVVAGASCGFVAWIVFLANVRVAVVTAQRLPVMIAL